MRHHCHKIEATLDRFQEAHFWLHCMEDSYHTSDHFRWFLNVFLKALNEIPALLKTELQNDDAWRVWYKPMHAALKIDPLISFLSLKRNFVVHQSMLVPKSKGAVGITELRGMKLSCGIPVNPFEDSDEAMNRYLKVAAEHGDFLGLLIRDEDSIPCVHRTWQLEQFDEEIVALCSKAWLRTGRNITASLQFLGQEIAPYSLNCGRHKSEEQRFQMKLYDREILIAQLKSLSQNTEVG